MKKLILLMLLIPSLLFAGSLQNMHKSAIARKNVISGFLVTETFEASGYDNGTCGTAPCWTVATGTPDPDYSTSGIDMEGSLCLELGPSDGSTLSFSEITGEAQFIFKLRKNEVTETNVYVAWIRDGGAELVRVQWAVTGALRAYNGSFSNLTTTTIGANESKWVRLRYVPGTGANAVAAVAVWTGAAWDEELTSSGAQTTYADQLQVENAEDTEIFYVDNVGVSDEAITSP